jgi:hypothetical protein
LGREVVLVLDQDDGRGGRIDGHGGSPFAAGCRLAVPRATQMVDACQMMVGTELPTEKELTEHLGVSRSTIREALDVMRTPGIYANEVPDG